MAAIKIQMKNDPTAVSWPRRPLLFLGVSVMRQRLLVAFAAAFVPVWSSPARADEADDRAEAAVKKLDGSLVRNQTLPGKPLVSVMLSMSKCTDDDLKMLADLKSISYLVLYNTGITDAGLQHLVGLQSLTRIDVMKPKITDAGLKVLAGMPNLEGLELATNGLTGEGLKNLAGHKSLSRLNLRATKV